MSTPMPPSSDEPIPYEIGPLTTILAWGFRLSLTFLGLGLLIALIQQEPLAEQVEPIGDVLGGLFDLQATAFIDLGIIILLLTPVATVATLVMGFIQARDRIFSLISVFVLGALALAILLAFF